MEITITGFLLRRIFIFLTLLLLAVSVYPQEPSSLIDIVQHSGFIFVGTVKAIGAATPTIIREPNSAIVTVDRVLETQPMIGNPAKQNVTVRLLDPQRFKRGDQAVFYTYVHSAGATLGLVEVASEPPERADVVEKQIKEARKTLADEALANRLASAELVVVGVVTETKPTEEARERKSEHDPMWWRARIRVTSFEKGQKTDEPVYVNFASSDDVVWERSPKPKVGDKGIYLLQPDIEKRYQVSGLFLIDPLDALKTTELERVRRLLKNPPVR